ncbi:hypothetical protein NIES4101_74430 [Calothrix sp. NIES-4101]|nr:hypothetical protein NIES4101_74430 [Calothrix sp. NIES-4101]
MMYKKAVFLSVLGLSTTSFLINSITTQVVASEGEITQNIANNDEQIHHKYGQNLAENLDNNQRLNISERAADLESPENESLNIEITSQPLELEYFCRDFPDNPYCQKSSPSVLQTEKKASEISSQSTPSRRSSWAVTPELGTLGFGASVTKLLTSNFNARVGLNGAAIGLGGYQKRKEEVTYDATLNLLNLSALVDYHPFKNSSFRVTSGLVFNDSNVEGKARIRDGVTFEYDGNRYTNKDIAAVKGKVSFPHNIAPYIGIGWGNAVKPGKRWGFSANLGVILTGAPQVNLDANIINDSLRDQINRDLRVEKKELEDDLKGFSVFPVLSLGVSYQF